MKILVSSLFLLMLVRFSSAQTFCDSAYNTCDSVSITSVTFIGDEVYGDKLFFRIQTNHENLYAPNFIVCPDDESIIFENPSYSFFSIHGPSEVQLLYYFNEFDFTGPSEFGGRIINDNSNNEFSNCEMGFNVIVDGTDAISTIIQENNILIYPNPANEIVNIQSGIDFDPVKNVTIKNINGSPITLLGNNFSYNIKHLDKGVYFLFVELQSNFVGIRKLVIL